MIRAACPADAEAVSALIEAAYRGYVPLLGRDPQPMGDDYAALIAAGEVHVLELENRIVGVLVLQDAEGAMLVRTVGILPGEQRKGLGTRLMTFAERVADDRDIPILRLYTNEVMAGTVSLYSRLGYAETHRTGPDGRQVIYMAKDLAAKRNGSKSECTHA